MERLSILVRAAGLRCARVPLTEEKRKEWGSRTSAWTCTVCYQGRTIQTPFFMGSAIKGEPTVAAVLSSLVYDAQAGALRLSEFAEDFGYPARDEETRKRWRACREVRSALRTLLGADFRRFLNAENDI